VIEVLINRLRGKLCPGMIETRRGLGYLVKSASTHHG
jgi:DNA-binding response OmpR family regulator